MELKLGTRVRVTTGRYAGTHGVIIGGPHKSDVGPPTWDIRMDGSTGTAWNFPEDRLARVGDDPPTHAAAMFTLAQRLDELERASDSAGFTSVRLKAMEARLATVEAHIKGMMGDGSDVEWPEAPRPLEVGDVVEVLPAPGGREFGNPRAQALVGRRFKIVGSEAGAWRLGVGSGDLETLWEDGELRRVEPDETAREQGVTYDVNQPISDEALVAELVRRGKKWARVWGDAHPEDDWDVPRSRQNRVDCIKAMVGTLLTDHEL